MSDDLYATRLRWSAGLGAGVAKLRGKRVVLTAPPQLPSVPDLAEVDYVPELSMGRVRQSTGAWRDMEGYEMREADQFLHDAVRAA